MSKTDKTEPRDSGLWRRYRGDQEGPSGSPAAAERPDSSTLAAYLDGTLSEVERERVEAVLARSPGDLELVLAARDALAAGAGPAPDPLVARACALVPAAKAAGLLPRMAGLAAGPDSPLGWFWRPAAWSAAAAAVLLACTVGFQLGESGYAGALSVEQFQAWEVVGVFGQATEDFL